MSIPKNWINYQINKDNFKYFYDCVRYFDNIIDINGNDNILVYNIHYNEWYKSNYICKINQGIYRMGVTIINKTIHIIGGHRQTGIVFQNQESNNKYIKINLKDLNEYYKLLIQAYWRLNTNCNIIHVISSIIQMFYTPTA